MGSHQYSVTPDAQAIIPLRRQLAWTQQEAATKAGYSVRLIRKIEKQQPVRSQTLKDVIQCYSDALKCDSYHLEDFITNSAKNNGEASDKPSEDCSLVERTREYYDAVYQKRQLNRIADYTCPDIRFTSEGETRIGVDAIRKRAATLLDAFDPIKFSVERSFSKDQIVVTSWSVKMKHVGGFFDIPATGKWVDVRGNSIIVFAEGLAVESEDQFDLDGLVRQLTGQKPLVI